MEKLRVVNRMDAARAGNAPSWRRRGRSESARRACVGRVRVEGASAAKHDLLAVIDSVRDWTETRAAVGAVIARGYLDGTGAFPERLPWLILTGQFLDEFTHAAGRWADWAAEVVQAWPDDIGSAEPEWATLENMARKHEAYLQRAESRRREAQTAKATPPS